MRLAALQDPGNATADSTAFRIEGISVPSYSPVTTVGGASGVEVLIDSLRVPVAPTGEELLREIPAVHVRTNSRGEAELSVRGSESRQVAVFLDGVPLTLGWDARTDLSVLPATAVRGIRFVRGLSSILHGPNVLGGVVEMETTPSGSRADRRSVTGSIGVDEVGGYAFSGGAREPFRTSTGSGVVGVGVGFRDSPGDPLANGVQEPVETGDALRLNTDVQNVDGFLSMRYVTDNGAWSNVSVTGHRAERGIAAELGAADPRLWRMPEVSRAIVAMSGGTGRRTTAVGTGDVQASVGLDFGRTEIRSFPNRSYDVFTGSEDGRDRTLSTRLLGEHSLGGRADLRSAVTFADIVHDEIVDDVTREFRQTLFSAGLETVVRLIDRPRGPLDGVRLSAGAVYDRGSTPRTGGFESIGTLHDWGARLGLSAVIQDGRALVHLGVSRRGRFPSLREAYSEAIGRFVPNPDLRLEVLRSAEGGVTTRFGDGEVQVVVFHTRLTDAIRRITLPDGRRRRVNSEELTSTGLESFVSQSFGPMSLGAALTVQAVDLRDPETGISMEPENLPERTARIFAEGTLAAGLSARVEAEHTGGQFCQDPDSGVDVRLDAATRLQASLGRVWARGGAGVLEARVSASNLTDTATFDQCGLPRPGRLLRLQVSVR